METAIGIFIKFPRTGEVKTRLARSIGDRKATRVYAELARHTLVVAAQAARRSGLRVTLFIQGGSRKEFRDWIGGGYAMAEQCEGNLGARMDHALRHLLNASAQSGGGAFLIGTDCPGIDADRLADAAERLRTDDVVLGPTPDGGYYLIGLRKPSPFLFQGIEWSAGEVCEKTLRKAAGAGLHVGLLPPLRDIDTLHDLRACRDELPIILREILTIF